MQTPIPQEWVDVLNKVQARFPLAVIAGGALRDLFNGKPIKDVDIFIPANSDTETNTYALYEMFFDEDIDLHKSSSYGTKAIPEDADRDLYAILNLKKEWKYDLILCTEQAAQMSTFDINICQITFDGTDVKTTPAYDECIETKVIKVMNINRTDRNVARLERIAAKYSKPEWNVEGITYVVDLL